MSVNMMKTISAVRLVIGSKQLLVMSIFAARMFDGLKSSSIFDYLLPTCHCSTKPNFKCEFSRSLNGILEKIGTFGNAVIYKYVWDTCT